MQPEKRSPRRADNATRAKVSGQPDQHQSTADTAHLEAMAHQSARLRGCTCQPTVTIYTLSPKITRAAVAHDDWCPVVAEGAA